MSQNKHGFFASLNRAGTSINIAVAETAEMAANYATAGNKYHVVDADAGVLGGQQLIRLEID